jgi:hypothetical protein
MGNAFACVPHKEQRAAAIHQHLDANGSMSCRIDAGPPAPPAFAPCALERLSRRHPRRRQQLAFLPALRVGPARRRSSLPDAPT